MALSRSECLLCHTCYDTWGVLLQGLSKEPPHLPANTSYNKPGLQVLRTNSNLDPHEMENVFVCLFVWFFGVFLSHSRIFHSFGDVIIDGEGLQILTYARHFWPLSSEGSLVCHTCDTGHPFIMVISKDP